VLKAQNRKEIEGSVAEKLTRPD